jgi:arsenate reductase (glutaredoxin)
MEVWNNPSCSKCAVARETLDAAAVPYQLRAYLEQPPTDAELADVLARLGMQPWDICRLAEPAAVARGMARWSRDPADVPRWIQAMVGAPELIQRPILLLDDGTAVLGRTTEALDQALRHGPATTRATEATEGS